MSLTAMGWIAGPLSPPLRLESRGLRVRTSIAIAGTVFAMHRASAPGRLFGPPGRPAPSMAARAIATMFGSPPGPFPREIGLSFTSSRWRGRTARTAPTSSRSIIASAANSVPCLTFGQLTLSSTPGIAAMVSKPRATAT